MGEKRRRSVLRAARRSSRAIPTLVALAFLLIGTTGTLIAESRVSQGVDERRAEEFDKEVDDIAAGIEGRIDEAEAILSGLKGLFVTGDVDRDDFHNYITAIDQAPGSEAIQALEFARLVERTGVSTFEIAVRSDTSFDPSGYPSFEVHPSGESSDLFVVDFIEPMEGNEEAFGFDLGSDAARRGAVEKARDSGALVATEGIELVQDSEASPAVLLMLPTYEVGKSLSTVEQRRAAFLGIVLGVFRVQDLLEGLTHPKSAFTISISDVGEVASPVAGWDLLFAENWSADVKRDGLYSVTALVVGDRRWVVDARETGEGFGDPLLENLSEFLLVTGLMTSVSFAVAGYVMMNSRQKAASEARRATADLLAKADELRAARDQAMEADRLKTSFLATMSHELRTPLNAVIGFGGMLANQSVGSLNGKQSQYVENIVGSGIHLLELIDELLDLVRIEADEEALNLNAVDLRKTIDESVTIVQPNAPEGMLEWHNDPSEKLIWVHADARRLRQVLMNLLVNAVKFTPRGGRVGIESRQVQGNAEFVVWDTGMGIAADELSQVFEPFFQVDSSLARQHGGSGLGLALTKRIVELHGGRITVESEPDRGSRFTVFWPLARSAERTEPPRFGTPIESNGDRSVRTVVVAEDSAMNLMIMTDLLELKGWQVIPALDGEEAVRVTRASVPDLVLMDIQLPTMDGLAATRELKADPRTSSIPVLAVTALAMPSDLDKCLEAGCDGYVTKPFTPEEFELVIEETLNPVAPTPL